MNLQYILLSAALGLACSAAQAQRAPSVRAELTAEHQVWQEEHQRWQTEHADAGRRLQAVAAALAKGDPRLDQHGGEIATHGSALAANGNSAALELTHARLRAKHEEARDAHHELMDSVRDLEITASEDQITNRAEMAPAGAKPQ